MMCCSNSFIIFTLICFVFSLLSGGGFLYYLKIKNQGMGPNNYKVIAICLVAPILLVITKIGFFEQQSLSVIWGAFLGYIFTSQSGKNDSAVRGASNNDDAISSNNEEILK